MRANHRMRLVVLAAALILSLAATAGCRLLQPPSTTPPPVPAPPTAPGIAELAEPGMQLLYVSHQGELVLANIGSTSPLAEPRTVVLRHGVGLSYTSAAWSPDGEQLAFTRQVATPQRDLLDILALETRTGKTSAVTADWHVFGYGHIHWLPGGEHILLEEGTGPSRGLTLFSVGGAAPLETGAYIWYAWSPDGKQIALCSPRRTDPPMPWGDGETGDVVLWTVSTGETITLLEGTPDYLYFPQAWTAPSTLLVGRLSPGQAAEYYECDPTDPGAPLRPLAGLPRHLSREAILDLIPVDLHEPFVRSGQFAWAADLSYVALILFRQVESAELWVFSADGADARLIADDARGGQSLWRPGRDSLESMGQ